MMDDMSRFGPTYWTFEAYEPSGKLVRVGVNMQEVETLTNIPHEHYTERIFPTRQEAEEYVAGLKEKGVVTDKGKVWYFENNFATLD